jgi:hypothetical protein
MYGCARVHHTHGQVQAADELLLLVQSAADVADKTIERSFSARQADPILFEVLKIPLYPSRAAIPQPVPRARHKVLRLELSVHMLSRGGGAAGPAAEATDGSQGRL